jgi:hypothetical protein
MLGMNLSGQPALILPAHQQNEAWALGTIIIKASLLYPVPDRTRGKPSGAAGAGHP